MKIAIAIVLAALIIATSIILTNRYTLVSIGGSTGGAWRLDTLTGKMTICAASPTELVCLKAPLPAD